jgi:hypothetical protein
MHAGPYLLLRLSGGGAVLLHEFPEGAELEEVARSGELLRPSASPVEDIGATCLYRDSTGWLQRHAGIEPMDQVDTHKALHASNMPSVYFVKNQECTKLLN